jgi:predicted O-methyltransferase YrrM
VASSLISPARATELVRDVGGLVLDRRFSEISPIPPLPSSLEAAIDRHFVALPPRGLFESGNQTFEGLLTLVSIAKAIGATTVFEIGTYNGLTALALAENLPAAAVHTLDLGADERPVYDLYAGEAGHIRYGRERLQREEMARRGIMQHFSDSALFDYGPFRSKIDLVYVDGAHSSAYVANDSEAAFLMASETAAIVWDDYVRQVEPVATYLDGLKRDGLFRFPGTRLVVWFSPGGLKRLGTTTEPSEGRFRTDR